MTDEEQLAARYVNADGTCGTCGLTIRACWCGKEAPPMTADESEGAVMSAYYPHGIIGDLLVYQRQLNEWAKTATREQKTALALASLRHMQGQAYLLDEDEDD